jgi:hypothetical protein
MQKGLLRLAKQPLLQRLTISGAFPRCCFRCCRHRYYLRETRRRHRQKTLRPNSYGSPAMLHVACRYLRSSPRLKNYGLPAVLHAECFHCQISLAQANCSSGCHHKWIRRYDQIRFWFRSRRCSLTRSTFSVPDS